MRKECGWLVAGAVGEPDHEFRLLEFASKFWTRLLDQSVVPKAQNCAIWRGHTLTPYDVLTVADLAEM